MRPGKSGLDYFPFDIDFFQDEKIEYVSARFGIKGEIITIKLLCRLYRQGYYMLWGEDESILFAKRAGEGIAPALVNEVIQELIKRAFFDRCIFDRFGILTSKGIQERYFEAIKRRKKIDVEKCYLLIDVNILGDNVNIIDNNVNINTQIEKEIESKESKKKETQSVILPFDNEFKKMWELWREYKEKHFKFRYKTPQSEQAALQELVNKGGGCEQTCIEIIHQSMANGWKGFFELKNERNHGTKTFDFNELQREVAKRCKD